MLIGQHDPGGIAELEEPRDAGEPGLRGIEVLDLLGPEAAADRVRRIGEHRDPVRVHHHGAARIDEAGELLVARREAHRGPVADREVGQHIDAVVEVVGMGERAALGGHAERRVAGVRLVLDEAQRAAHGSGAVQRALRAAQHLDPRDVGKPQVGEHRRLIDIGGHRRREEVLEAAAAHRAGVDAADDEGVVGAVAAHTAVGDDEPGHMVRDAGEVAHCEPLQVLAARHRDVDGDLEDGLLTPRRGDHHLLETLRAALLRLCVGREDGRDGRSDQARRTQQQRALTMPTDVPIGVIDHVGRSRC